LVVAVARNIDSTPQGAAIDVFFIFDGGCCRTSTSTPSGPAINIFNYGGGRYQKYRQHP
jgi:hypothetical protein